MVTIRHFAAMWVLFASCRTVLADCEYGWLPIPIDSGFDGNVYDAISWDSDGDGPEPNILVACGDFDFAGSTEAHGIAYWKDQSWHDMAGGLNGTVRALEVYQGQLIASGQFSATGFPQVHNIARWNGSGWESVGSMSSSYTPAIVQTHGLLYAFSNQAIRRWNGSTWQIVGSVFGGNIPQGLSLGVFGNELVVGGIFQSMTGFDNLANGVARWNGQIWQSLETGVTGGAPSYVSAIQPVDSYLVLGGNFTIAGELSVANVAIWNGDEWNDFGSGFDTSVFDLTLFNGELFAGGLFQSAGGSEVNHVSRRHDGQWKDLDGGTDGSVRSFATYNGELILVGSFSIAGDHDSQGWARWGRLGLLGDWQNDGSLEIEDFSGVPICLSGPRKLHQSANDSTGCLCSFNSDGDSDFDLRDLSNIQNSVEWE